MRGVVRLSGLFVALIGVSMATAPPTVTFIERQPDLIAGSGSSAIAAADLDGDGNIDLAVANYDSDDVSIFWGNGDGTFVAAAQNPISVTLPGTSTFESPVAIAIEPITGNPLLPDIITANESGGTVSVIPNLGGRNFGAAIESPAGMSPEAVVVADFDGDTILDVATPNFFDDTVTILLGKGDGTLAMLAVCSNQSGHACHVSGDCPSGGTCNPQPIAVGSEPDALAAVDLNQDGKIDLIVANSSGGSNQAGSLMVLKGMGDGTFTPQLEINSDTFNNPVAITAASGPLDLNGDSFPDVAVVNDAVDSVSVLFGKGDLTFQSPITLNLSAGSVPEGIVVAAFTGVGQPAGIATSASYEDKVSVFVGLGNGTFAAPQDFTLAGASMPSPWGIAVGDFDKDGKIDFVTANTLSDGSGGASVFLNATGVTPAGCVGDCSGDLVVTVDEILTMVNIALGSVPVSACVAGDANGDQLITVDEILTAVNNALNGCKP